MSAAEILTPPTHSPTPEGELLPPRRWTTTEFFRAVELGTFRDDERLELIDGEIITNVSPKKAPHSTAVLTVAEELAHVFGPEFHARPEQPMTIGDRSAPEPDVLVVRGRPRDYAERHPTNEDALLVVEVSDATLAQDRRVKAALYAEAGIGEFWIVNLPERRLEVHREPVALGTGFAYRVVSLFLEGDTVSPVATPRASVPVTSLLP